MLCFPVLTPEVSWHLDEGAEGGSTAASQPPPLYFTLVTLHYSIHMAHSFFVLQENSGEGIDLSKLSAKHMNLRKFNPLSMCLHILVLIIILTDQNILLNGSVKKLWALYKWFSKFPLPLPVKIANEAEHRHEGHIRINVFMIHLGVKITVCSRRGSVPCAKTSRLSDTSWRNHSGTQDGADKPSLATGDPQDIPECSWANASEHQDCLIYSSLWLYTVLSSPPIFCLALPCLLFPPFRVQFFVSQQVVVVRRVLRPTRTAWETSAFLLLLRSDLEQTCGGALDAASGLLLCVSCFAWCREMVLPHHPTMSKYPIERSTVGSCYCLPSQPLLAQARCMPLWTKSLCGLFGVFVWPQLSPLPGHKAPAFRVWCGLVTPYTFRAEITIATGAWLCLHYFPFGCGTYDSL